MTNKDFAWQGHAAMLSANIIWGLNAPIGKEALLELPPQVITSFRLAGGCLAFWLLSAFLPGEHVPRRDKILFAFAALAGFTFNQGLFITGLSLTSPVDAAIITSVLPVITMLLAAVLLREPITWKKVAGIVLGITGALILIAGGGHGHGTAGDSSLTGNVLCFTAQISFALYLTLFKGLISRYSPVTVSKWLFLFGSVFYLPFAARSVAAVDYAAVSPQLWWRVAYIILGATFVAYLLIPVGQKLLRPTIVSMYNYVQPVVASAVSVMLGLSMFGATSALAVVLIFTGVWFVTHSKSRADMEREKSV